MKRVFEVLGVWFELKDSPDNLYDDFGLPIGTQRAMEDHILWIAPGMSEEERLQAVAVGVAGIIREMLTNCSGEAPRLIPVRELGPS